MVIIASIKNERGKKETFKGESLSKAAMNLQKNYTLDGQTFSLSLGVKRSWLTKPILVYEKISIKKANLIDAIEFMVSSHKKNFD